MGMSMPMEFTASSVFLSLSPSLPHIEQTTDYLAPVLLSRLGMSNLCTSRLVFLHITFHIH